MSDATGVIGPDAAVAWLNEAARYFEIRPTHGEDSAYWSNIYNAENCRKIAALISIRGPSAFCPACQSVGMSNCAHFDECGQPCCIMCKQTLPRTQERLGEAG